MQDPGGFVAPPWPLARNDFPCSARNDAVFRAAMGLLVI